MKTYMPAMNTVKKHWYLIDANDKVLGRLASRLAFYLRGKHKPEFASHIDVGDFLVVINADKVKVTGKKFTQKEYYRHSGYPGGLKVTSFEKLLQNSPTLVLEKAVRGMLPRGPLGRKMMKKLKLYAGPDHPHHSQMPSVAEF